MTDYQSKYIDYLSLQTTNPKIDYLRTGGKKMGHKTFRLSSQHFQISLYLGFDCISYIRPFCLSGELKYSKIIIDAYVYQKADNDRVPQLLLWSGSP